MKNGLMIGAFSLVDTTMTNWTRRVLTGVMAIAMAAPLAVAGDRHDRRSHCGDDRAYDQDRYTDRGGYRDSSYRDYNYRDDNSRDYDRDNGYYGYGDYRGQRSAGKSAAIVGGSAAAGAVIGGLTRGGKGAAVGAVVGGIGGLVYDRATKNTYRDGRRW
jgi:hypothetical protein